MRKLNAKEIEFEEKLSFEYKDFTEVIVKLDQSIEKLNNLLSVNIDKRFIKDKQEYSVEYIQPIINKLQELIDLNDKNLVLKQKFRINSPLVVGEKNLAEILTILFKSLENANKLQSSQTSNLYVTNV